MRQHGCVLFSSHIQLCGPSYGMEKAGLNQSQAWVKQDGKSEGLKGGKEGTQE